MSRLLHWKRQAIPSPCKRLAVVVDNSFSCKQYCCLIHQHWFSEKRPGLARLTGWGGRQPDIILAADHHNFCKVSVFSSCVTIFFAPPPPPKLALFWMEEDIPGRKFSKIRFKTVEFYALLSRFSHIFPWSFKVNPIGTVNSRSSAGGSFVLRLIRGHQISPNLATVQVQYSGILRQ